MRAAEHAGGIGTRRRVGQLGLVGLLDHAVEFLQGLDGLLHAHWVADLDGRGQGSLRHHGLELVVPFLVGEIERIGGLHLGHADARQFADEAQLAHHLEPSAECADVAEVATGNDDPVGHAPVELLHDLDAHGLLSFHAQRVHAVGQVHAFLVGQALHHLHAIVEVAFHGQHGGAIGQRLHQLRGGNLASRKQNHGADASSGGIGRQRRRGVAGRGASHGRDGPSVCDHLLDRGHEHGHAQILERPGVRVAAHLDPEILDAQFAAVALGPEQVAAALVHRHHVLVANVRVNPLAFAPHP